MEKKIPFTQEAYDQLVKDLNNLKNVERPRVLQELVDARAQGDLSENAEYHAAKERLAAIDNVELPKLQDQLARAEVVSFDASSDSIRFGATVTVKNLKTKRDVVYQLVSPKAWTPSTAKSASRVPSVQPSWVRSAAIR